MEPQTADLFQLCFHNSYIYNGASNKYFNVLVGKNLSKVYIYCSFCEQ